jgi:cell wall-associated NlpC family hydrolase
MQGLPAPLATRAAPWLLAAALALGGTAARAEPDAAHDPVSRLLAEKGLVEPFASTPNPGNTFVGRIRDTASDMVITAMNFLGVRYRRGGNSAEEGFDCSGFTRHIFEQSLGLVLPRRAPVKRLAQYAKRMSSTRTVVPERGAWMNLPSPT